MNKIITLAITIMIFAGFSVHCFSYAATSDTFRCPNGAIIAVNERLSTVASRCDQPSSVSRRIVTRGLYAGYYETVEIEEWAYNLGPTRFMYYLIFENGYLARIDIGDYGN